MIRSLWSAASGMHAQQVNLDVISNNLANVDTVGFKKSRAEFQDVMYQTIKAAGTPNAAGNQIPVGIQIGLGTKVVTVGKLFSQGNLTQTENQLDVAIEGDGFFKVLLPNGDVAYTRDGAFKIDKEGRLVTHDGYVILPEITIPPEATRVNIAKDGTVTVEIPGQPTPQELGRINLSKFINPSGLKAIGNNLFMETDASGAPQDGVPGTEGFGTLAQGFLESSNVNVVEEMVNMIIAHRAYDFNSKAIQTSDAMLQTATNLKR
jgi:flagellar basal-body rod protein FlgG